MNSVDPIRNMKDVEKLKKYFKKKDLRNYTMFVMGLNVALRISDLLSLRWSDVLDKQHKFKNIKIKEQKTQKSREIELNETCRIALNDLKSTIEDFDMNDHIFVSREANDKPITKKDFLAAINKITKSKGVGMEHKVGEKTVKKLATHEKLGVIKERLERKPVYHMAFLVLINSNLELEDVLNLKVKDAKNLSEECFLYIENYIKKAEDDEYVFLKVRGRTKPIERGQSFTILKDATKAVGCESLIATHSLRKTWGWYSWQQGIDPVIIMDAYNHDSLKTTKRYLGITQSDINKVYRTINI